MTVMTSTVAGMVIVGAGQAGVRAAFALRANGWTGSVTLLGAEPVPPYERPPLSKTVLTSPAEPGPPLICDAAALRAAGIDWFAGVAVTRIDRAARQVELASGACVPYQRLLLATGALPRRLPVLAGNASGAVRYLRDYGHALALRRLMSRDTRLAVIGGGFLGLEIAAAAIARECTVTVVEMAARLLQRVVPEDQAHLLAERHRRAGVDLRYGAGATELHHDDGALRLGLTTGDPITCDLVVAAIGSAPATALAEEAGLAVDNGIRVDDRLVTSDPDILAAGDCCSFPHPLYEHRRVRLEAWHNAEEQGPAAARTMLEIPDAVVAVPSVPSFWSDQYELTLHVVGLPDPAHTPVVRHRADGADIRFELGQDGRLMAAAAVGPGTATAKDIRIAEKLIAAEATPAAHVLADPTFALKTLLSEARRRSPVHDPRPRSEPAR
jgi:3-phenylpropionate/trans-cinnamate dioxygenase ferredoxin reductase subunit